MADSQQKVPPAAPETDEEVEPVDKEELASAKDVVQALLKASKAQRLYLPNNPVRQKFVADLIDKFQSHLDAYTTLRLKVRQYELVFGNQAVYENANRLESVAFRMYVDGLREISFHEGLDPKEIEEFFEILSKEYDTGSPDDDIITLLWEKNFAHITYVVTNEFLSGDEPAPDMVRDDDKMDIGIKEAMQEAKAAASSVKEDIISNPLLNQDRPDLQVFRLSESEVERIRREMEMEENYHFVSELMDILFAIIYIEEDYESFEQIVEILDDMLEALSVNGEFQQASKILRLYRELSDPKRGLGQKHLQRLSAGVDKAATEGRLSNLEEILENKGLETAEHLYTFLTLLNKNAIIPLTNLLGSFKHMEIRRVLCEALAELGRYDINLLASRITDPRWFIVRNIALILGRLGGQQVIGYLEKIVDHKEAKVRKEVFRSLAGLHHDRASEQIMRFLNDPDKPLRIDAARYLASCRYAPAEKVLLDLVGTGEFEEKELFEKKEILESLAIIGGDRVVPTFRKYVRRRRWFWQKKSGHDEMGICAALALKAIGTAEAESALKEGMRVGSKVVKETCQKMVEESHAETEPARSGAAS